MTGQDSLIFVVDDDEAVRDALARLFHSVNMKTETYASAEQFLESYKPRETVCLIADVRMPGMSGLELLETLVAQAIALPVILMTGHGDAEMEKRALKAGAAAFFHKPIDDRALLDEVNRCID